MVDKIRLLLAGVGIWMALAGCSTAVQTTACSALERVNEPVDRLVEAIGNASTSDIKDLKARLDGPVESVRRANQALSAPGITQWLLAYGLLSDTIDDIPEDEPLSDEAAGQIESAAEDLKSELNQVFESLECNP